MIAEAREQICFAQRLIRPAADAADADQRFGAARVRAIHFVGGDREHRLEQPDQRGRGWRIAWCARRPRAHRFRPRRSSGSSARWRCSSNLPSASSASGCAGMTRPVLERGEDAGREFAHQNRPARDSNCVGLPRCSPPRRDPVGGPRQQLREIHAWSAEERPPARSVAQQRVVRFAAGERDLDVQHPCELRGTRHGRSPLQDPRCSTISGGVDAWSSAARAIAFASPCQIVLKYPIVTSTGSRRDTRRARSTSTP